MGDSRGGCDSGDHDGDYGGGERIRRAEVTEQANTPPRDRMSSCISCTSVTTWIQMIQTSVFEGKVDDAIAKAKAKMKAIANE